MAAFGKFILNFTKRLQLQFLTFFCTNEGKIDHSCRASRYQIKPFRRMVRRLEDILDHSAVTELAQLSEQGPDFVLKVDELRKPFHHLMANWEKAGIVTEGNVDTLLVLLEEVEAYQALDVVTEYRSSSSNSSAEKSGKFSTAPPGNGVANHPSFTPSKECACYNS